MVCVTSCLEIADDLLVELELLLLEPIVLPSDEPVQAT
jgi:hypothetical protein